MTRGHTKRRRQTARMTLILFAAAYLVTAAAATGAKATPGVAAKPKDTTERRHDGVSSGAAAQAFIDGALNHSAHQTPAIDGSKNPELIPDHVAFRLFLNALTPSVDRGKQADRIRRARSTFASEYCSGDGLGVDAQDVESWTTSLLAAADVFHLSSSAQGNDPESVRAARDMLAAATNAELTRVLPPNGRSRLNCYIEKAIKPRTNYFQASAH